MTRYLFIIAVLFACEKNSISSIPQDYRRAEAALDTVFTDILLKHEALLNSEGNGPAIFLKDKIYSLESNSYTAEDTSMSQLGHDVWGAVGIYNKGELTISILTFGDQFITHKVSNRKISSEFREHYKSDDFLKLKKADPPTNELVIPLALAEVQLSKTSNFKLGELIYGKAKIVSQPYYLKSLDFDFKHIKREYEYYFKFKVRTE